MSLCSRNVAVVTHAQEQHCREEPPHGSLDQAHPRHVKEAVTGSQSDFVLMAGPRYFASAAICSEHRAPLDHALESTNSVVSTICCCIGSAGPGIALARAVHPSVSRKLTARMEARFASRRELQQALLSWLEVVRKDPGVAQACVYEDVVSPGVFALQADMVTSAAMDRHMGSDAFSALMGAITVLADHVQMSIDQPSVEFGPGAVAIRLGPIDDLVTGRPGEG